MSKWALRLLLPWLLLSLLLFLLLLWWCCYEEQAASLILTSFTFNSTGCLFYRQQQHHMAAVTRARACTHKKKKNLLKARWTVMHICLHSMHICKQTAVIGRHVILSHADSLTCISKCKCRPSKGTHVHKYRLKWICTNLKEGRVRRCFSVWWSRWLQLLLFPVTKLINYHCMWTDYRSKEPAERRVPYVNSVNVIDVRGPSSLPSCFWS